MFTYQVDRDLELRLLETANAEELFQLNQDNREYLRRWLPWLDGVKEVADTRNFITMSKKQYGDNLGIQAGIWNQGRLTGVIGHYNLNWAHRSVNLGYWLGEKYQGQGVMTRACRAMIEYSFKDLGLHRVEIRCSQENFKSRAIPERLGFTREGVIRQAEWLYDHFEDDVVYGLLAPEWQGVGT